MRHEERLQMLWAVSFIISGVVFGLAFWFTPIIGFLAVLGYIILYVGLAFAFLMVFRGMATLNIELMDALKTRKKELEEMKRVVEKKYYKKKIDEETFKKLMQDYEEKLTEIEVKINNLKRI
ncbi:MAG: hypothetical protein DRP13_02735 [Candidatus Aenigmatarchaeota archaeon]|nr:MAG: hypothetical protein DRP13_02735 [Candidatus Aenigmarchaeota archaeon]